MTRHEVLLGGPNEHRFGLARAVRVGNQVSVGGTAAIRPDGTNIPADDIAGQAARVWEIVGQALAAAGARPSDVVRTRTMLVRVEDAPIAIAARRAFLDGTMAAETIVQVVGFVDPAWQIEVEADAIIPEPVVPDLVVPGSAGG